MFKWNIFRVSQDSDKYAYEAWLHIHSGEHAQVLFQKMLVDVAQVYSQSFGNNWKSIKWSEIIKYLLNK